jgi:hypothetical protein
MTPEATNTNPTMAGPFGSPILIDMLVLSQSYLKPELTKRLYGFKQYEFLSNPL